ncbi:IclR family transcriptional regulator [Aeromicrobium camelliae]|uniref:IclR family transcriptional regulator n=2 Tax=Aeromicrobium camelliae TaxID=1538144 RepID=A0A3N6WP73_9ACTN|nr:IclR family transcriptional regulator [Aeromicrobium camelliae]
MAYFDHQRPELTLAEVAERSGMNKTTAYRLLNTLVMAGWLARSESNAYRPTMRVFQIGSVALASTNLPTEAKPVLRSLADRFGDTAYLMVPSGRNAVCIDAITGDSPVTVNAVAVGSSLPLHAAAGPVTMLAFVPGLLEEELSHDDREPFTPGTITDPEHLRSVVEKVREQGYAVSEGDFLSDVAAVAAPIFGSDGACVGTISLGGTVDRIRGARFDDIVAGVVAAGKDLTARLQGR